MGDEPQARSARGLVARGAACAFLAVAANVAVLNAGLAVTDLPSPYRLGAPGPIVVPVVAAVAATALYSALTRRSSRPFDPFVRYVGAGLVASFVPVAVAASVFDSSPTEVAVLVGMHVAVAVVIVGSFWPRFG